MIDKSEPFIALALFAGMLFGGIVGLIVGIVWLGVGVWFVERSRSRGLFADAAFALTWPIWLIVEGW